MTPERKTELVAEFRTHEDDTGSPEVQIAILTERINHLTQHFQIHHKDHAGRRGLLMMVSRRRGLLDYLKRIEFQRYKTIIGALGIRK
jgi:small subunit ribosomal protein S15